MLLRLPATAGTSAGLVEIQAPARAVRRAVARGELRARKLGRAWCATPSDIEAFIDARPAATVTSGFEPGGA